MSENEMQSNEGAMSESSPSTPDTAASSESAASSEATNSNNNSESASTPFHEHPRWKELIEQRNQFQGELQKMQSRLADYETRAKEASQPKELTSEQKMLERLKTIDPEFAKYNESVLSKLSKVEQLEQQWQADKQAAERQTVQNQLANLHEQNKVPAEYRDMYRDLIKARAAETGAKTSDLPGLFKSVHDSFSKILDTVKRSERQSYVAGKKQDSGIPSSQPRPTSPARATPAAKEFSKDPDAARNEVVSRTMQALRAGRSQ